MPLANTPAGPGAVRAVEAVRGAAVALADPEVSDDA
jgi:hypothetical protein